MKFTHPTVGLLGLIGAVSVSYTHLTKSYSRPNFQDLVQGATFNGEEASIFNPDLKPVRATNLDIYGEHYFGTLGLLSGGVFYKKLNDFIYQQTTDQTFRGIPDVEVTQSVNGDDASLLGFEIGYQQNLSFLPGVLKGLVEMCIRDRYSYDMDVPTFGVFETQPMPCCNYSPMLIVLLW